jgi:hypothetical protein
MQTGGECRRDKKINHARGFTSGREKNCIEEQLLLFQKFLVLAT